MIEAMGRGGAPRAAAASDTPNGPAKLAETAPAAGAVASQAPATANLARVAKDLAASPPVDSARVEALRAAIVSGEYRADPMKISERMMALEAGSKGA